MSEKEITEKTQAYIAFCKHLQSALLADESKHGGIVENTLAAEIGAILTSIEEKYEKVPEHLWAEIEMVDTYLL